MISAGTHTNFTAKIEISFLIQNSLEALLPHRIRGSESTYLQCLRKNVNLEFLIELKLGVYLRNISIFIRNYAHRSGQEPSTEL